MDLFRSSFDFCLNSMLFSVGSLHDKFFYKMEFGATTSRSHRGKLGKSYFFLVFSSFFLVFLVFSSFS